MRAMRGISAMLIATTTFWTLEPNSDIRAIARRMPGIAMMPSINRMMRLSTRRKNPASRPNRSPTVVVTAATRMPTVSEIRVPLSVRDSVDAPELIGAKGILQAWRAQTLHWIEPCRIRQQQRRQQRNDDEQQQHGAADQDNRMFREERREPANGTWAIARGGGRIDHGARHRHQYRTRGSNST